VKSYAVGMLKLILYPILQVYSDTLDLLDVLSRFTKKTLCSRDRHTLERLILVLGFLGRSVCVM